jgi:hypothetical protein
MDIKTLLQRSLPAVTLLVTVAASPVQASYVCTGLGAAAGDFFDGDLVDPLCDIGEVEAALGIDLTGVNIGGSKTNATEGTLPEGDPNAGEPFIDFWTQDEFALGTLDVTSWTDFTGTFSLTGDFEPLFFVVKYNNGYDVYTYMGGDTSPFGDSWDGTQRGDAGATCAAAGINCNALVSHISVYSAVPVPAAVWLFGSGLLGLVGIARRKRTS